MEPFSPTPGTGEINEDPMFVDPDNHDYHLQEGSPCIGSGMNGEDRGALPSNLTGLEDALASEMPTKITLGQNYPNPFNATTTIDYLLPVRGYVRLEVFDLLGHRVATLVDGEQSAGDRWVSWQAAEVASGIYLYKLTVDNHTEARKMLLLR